MEAQSSLILIKDNEENTALMVAIESLNEVVALELISQYPKHISTPNKYGKTALLLACQYGLFDIAKVIFY